MDINKELNQILKSQTKELGVLMYFYLSMQFEENIKVNDAWKQSQKGAVASLEVSKNNTKHLRFGSGALLNSFFKTKNLNYSNGLYTGELKSDLPYARIHEYGGFIKSKTKFSMFGGLMKMFNSTGNEAYKYMALSVLKNNGMNIPARPYFNPFIKEFNEKGIPEWWSNVEVLLQNYLNEATFNV